MIANRNNNTILCVGIVITFFSVLFSVDSDSVVDSSGGVGSPFSVILTIIYVLYATQLPIEEQLVLIALALPNTKALNIMGISGAVCVCAASAFVNYSKKKKSEGVVLLALVFLIYSLQYYYRFSDISLSIIRPIKTMMNITFFSMISYDVAVLKRSSKVGYDAAIGLFCGIVSSAVATIIKSGFTGRFSIVGNDPNMLAIECATAMAVFSLCFFEYKYLSASKYYILLGTLGLVILLGASRMGLLLFAFIITLSVLLNSKKMGKTSVLIVFIVLGLVAFLTSDMGQNALDSFMMKHYSLTQKEDLSNGRFNHWTNYIKVFNSDPTLWWFGLGNWNYYRLENQAHNFLIEDIANYGIIGLTLLYVTYIVIYRKTYRNAKFLSKERKTKISQIVPFLIPLIGGMTLHGLTNIIDTTLFFIGVLCMVRGKNSK